MLEDCIGKRSTPVKNAVERGAVKKFAEAIGDDHPIFTDEETGRESRFGVNIAPPTFPRVFDYGTIPDLNLPEKGLIHGEQIYHYERPLRVGEDVYCHAEVKNYYERDGQSGRMAFLQIKRYGNDPAGELIFTEEQVVIITEAVRERMQA
ncbi:MaoC family dehydratase N-terminal domain-containing protein [Thalassobacillus sp. CUG 92003]|uniref:MaoC family dehydratase N-terminal domain-containing protein n=1 Tax=Thalassobacillus sp. CUG 92003 TaxID=2736641 RepID=UPI0015E7815D|nr:MaoC family dehydratase N-terminal domain-containing protein [Thalassobacillus sp. CUG 92003]